MSDSLASQLRRRRTALKIEDVATLLNLPVKTVYSWATSGRIPSLKIGGLRRFDPAAVAEWLDGKAA